MTDTHRATLVRLGDTDLQIADPSQDIRGRDVLDQTGERIGSIEGLLIDDRQAHVRLMEVTSGGFLGIGEKKVLVPIDAITTINQDIVQIDKTREHIARGPGYDPTLIDEHDFDALYGYYGYAPYWSAGYVYPALPYYHHA